MNNMGYGPYGGFADPFKVGDVDHQSMAEAALNGVTAVDALYIAQDPQYQYVRDPATGQIVRWSDGTPMVERIPMEQRLAPIVLRRLNWYSWMKAVTMLVPVALFLYLGLVALLPEPLANFLQDTVLTIFAYGVVTVGGLLVCAGGVALVAYTIYAIIKRVFMHTPWKG